MCIRDRAELLYRSNPDKEVIKKYNHLVQETAKFMYSFATYDELGVRSVSYTHLDVYKRQIQDIGL